MKWIWLIAILIIIYGFYVGANIAFMAGVDIVAWPMVLVGAFVIGSVMYQYYNEFWK